MLKRVYITSFYAFFDIAGDELQAFREEFESQAQDLRLRGLVILAEEGVNGSVAGSAESVDAFKSMLTAHIGMIDFKDSEAEKQPFRRFFVKIRPEIVSLGDPGTKPNGERHYLSAAEWNQVIENEEEIVLLDARNAYEVAIGKFRGAVDPKLKKFSDFPAHVRTSGIPKSTKVLLYCTGGIRCEKAVLEMERQGYENVHQLKGGILRYLEEFPSGHFDGECFVFDHRAAVDRNLRPSRRYALCPHCGDPGDRRVQCLLCEKETIICMRCAAEESKNACSKDCAQMVKIRLSAVR